MSAMFMKKCSALLCIVILFSTTGCSGNDSVTATDAVAVDSTGKVTNTTTVTYKHVFGPKPNSSSANPNFIPGSDGSSVALVESVPSAFTLNQSPVQATLIATTDTGYTSSITVTLQPTSTAVSPVNAGDLVYAWAMPSNTEFTTWQQQLTANSISQVNVTSSVAAKFTGDGTSGRFPFTVLSTTSDAGTITLASTSLIVSSGDGSEPKRICPGGRINCPVQ